MAKMDDMEEVSYKESKAQTKARREDGLNMIRPFTFDEKKILWDGLYNDGYHKGNKIQEQIYDKRSTN